MQIFLILIFGIAAIFSFWAGYKRQQLFWPYIMAITSVSSGIIIWKYCLADEILIGFLILGVFFSILMGKAIFKAEEKNKDSLLDLHKILFYIFSFYMVFESVRGFVRWKNFSSLRWIAFYFLLILLVFIISKKPFSRMVFPKIKAFYLISLASSVYMLFYILHGLCAVAVRHVDWFYLQGKEWSGTSYALFILIVGVPSAFFLIINRNSGKKDRAVGFILIALSIIAAIFYGSRMLFLILLLFLVVLPFCNWLYKYVKKNVFIGIIGIFIVMGAVLLLLINSGDNIRKFYTELAGNRIFFGITYNKENHWQELGGDSDRYVAFLSSIDTIKKSWVATFFGYGIYSHHFEMVPSFIKYNAQFNLKLVEGEVIGPIYTSAMPALTVDAGLMGSFLLFFNFLFAGLVVLRLKNRNTLFFLAILLVAFFWLFVTNILDIVLLYILIMPNGLVYQLARKEPDLEI